MNDETPDSSVDSSGSHGVFAPGAYVDAAAGDDTEQYLLNDIGVALRLLSERGR